MNLVNERSGLSDKLLKSVILLAKKYDIERLFLFGSRARGDFKERSDIDLAALGGNISAFSFDVEEETPTLLFFDVVNLNQKINDELRNEIEKNSILIYEKTKTTNRFLCDNPKGNYNDDA